MMVHVYTLRLSSRHMCKFNILAGTGVNTGKKTSYNSISSVFFILKDKLQLYFISFFYYYFYGKVKIYIRNVILFSSPTMHMLYLSQCYT